jgi:1-acyl-sn-glycerol-3-phosphate acyltransferase
MMRIGEREPGLLARFVRGAIMAWYNRQGWSEEAQIPAERKYVIIAAPHTSNWDFPYFIGLTTKLGVKTHFMGKDSLFRWPFGRMMRDMGGVPVDRSKSTNAVDVMVKRFAEEDDFILTIAPEGTRGKARVWKSGFYQIAMQAGVPFALGMMDYAKKRGGLSGVFWPTGDYHADMTKLAEFYTSCTPKHPALATTDFGEG